MMIIREETVSDIRRKYPYLMEYDDDDIITWPDEELEVINDMCRIDYKKDHGTYLSEDVSIDK